MKRIKDSYECESEELDYGVSVHIYYDDDAESPREWDNIGTIYSNHRDYNPDRHSIEEIVENYDYQDEDGNFDEEKFSQDYVWLPIRAYIHSGITISVAGGYPYNDQWDSGLFGIIAAPHGTEGLSDEQIESNLRGEVNDLDMWYTGDIYGYSVEDENGAILDSCWGYYGSEGRKDARADAMAIAEDYIEKLKQEELEEEEWENNREDREFDEFWAKRGDISDSYMICDGRSSGKTKADYEEYLNEIGEGLDEEEFIIGGKDRYGMPYGTALRKFDPIAFNVGYNEWKLGY